ncbi:MAG: autotransporter domain-containing protein, partial [Verrucomicrobiota bacterium]|nr:autotransporter domain-containing protein [Verrucomicrobiota bacterium]
MAASLIVGANASSINNVMNLSGADSQLVVTNAGATAASDIRRGTFTQNGGTFRADNLLVTNAAGFYTLNGGTAIVQNSTNSNGVVFTVGNGTATARYTTLAGGTNVFLNDIMIANNATLVANGVVQGNVTNLVGGTLMGSGTIGGNLFNNGLLSPGNSPGILNITGNFIQGANGTTLIEVAGTGVGQFDQLNITGSATLNGTLQVVPFGGFVKFNSGETLTIITAAGGINGTFANVINTGALNFNVAYNANNVIIGVTQIPFATNPTLTPNQAAIARVLETIRNSATDEDWVNKVLPAINGLSAEQLPLAFDQMNPVFYQSMPQVNMSWMQTQFQNLRGRFEELRFGNQGGISTRGLSLFDAGGDRLMASSGSLIDSDSSAPLYMPRSVGWDKRVGMFISGSGEFGSLNDSSGLNGYDFTTAGVTLGLDYQLSLEMVVGVFGSYSNARTDQKANSGESDADSGRGGVYAGYFKKNSFLNVVAGGGSTSYETQRPINFGPISRTASASPEGQEAFAMIEAGHDFELGKLRLGPVGGFQYRHVNMDQFTESGAGALNLTMSQREMESIMSQLGVRASYEFKLGKVILYPNISARWQHEFAETQKAVEARFGVLNSAAFNIQTKGPDQDSALVNVGLNAYLSESISIFGGYNLQTSAGDDTVHGVNGGFSWQW